MNYEIQPNEKYKIGKILHRRAEPGTLGRGSWKEFVEVPVARVGSADASERQKGRRAVVVEKTTASVAVPARASLNGTQHVHTQAQWNIVVKRNKSIFQVLVLFFWGGSNFRLNITAIR